VFVAFVLAGARARLSRRARWAFAVSAAVVVLSELAFDYYVTGSWLPSARWAASDHQVAFTSPRLLLFVLAYGFDRMWGLLPHALIMIGALPGLILMRRESPGRAILVAATMLALVITAAAHSLSGSGTTPDRLIVATVPLLIWPIAVLVRRAWSSALFRTAAMIVGVLSLQAAFAYNWHHDKSTGPMYDVSASGWKPNLAFPLVPDLLVGSWRNTALFGLWILVIAGIVVLALRQRGRLRPSPASTIAAGMAGAIGFFTVTTAANDDWTRDDYLLDDRSSRESAAIALLALERCRICFSSDIGQTDWVRFKPNAATGGHADVNMDHRTATVRIVVDGQTDRLKFGRATVVFGDGSAPLSIGVVNERAVQHTYADLGTHSLQVMLETPSGTTELLHDHIDVR